MEDLDSESFADALREARVKLNAEGVRSVEIKTVLRATADGVRSWEWPE